MNSQSYTVVEHNNLNNFYSYELFWLFGVWSMIGTANQENTNKFRKHFSFLHQPDTPDGVIHLKGCHLKPCGKGQTLQKIISRLLDEPSLSVMG